MSIPTKEQLKARSRHLSKLLQEKFNVKVSHGQCLDVVAQLFGHKDWNTASAASPVDGEPLGRYELIEALLKGFHFYVEQPYKVEKYFAGRATANHSTEEGAHLFDQFKVQIDQKKQSVTLTLPQTTGVSASNEVVDMHRQLYRDREKLFDDKMDKPQLQKEVEEQIDRDIQAEMRKRYHE